MLVEHRINSVPQIFLIFLLFYYINWISSSKTTFSEKYKSPQIPLQFQRFTYTLPRNEATDKGRSNSLQSQKHFEVERKTLTKREARDNGKITQRGGGPQAIYRELTYFLNTSNATSCFHLQSRRAVKNLKDHQKKGNGRLNNNHFFSTTLTIAQPHPGIPPTLTKKGKTRDYTSHLEVLEKEAGNRKQKADFAKDVTPRTSAISNVIKNSKDLCTTYNCNSLTLPLPESSSLMQVNASLSKPGIVPTSLERAKSQVSKSLKSDVSLMKTEMNGVNVTKVKDSAEAAPTSSQTFEFLASQSQHHHKPHKARVHITRNSSFQKSIGSMPKADKHSTKTLDKKAKPVDEKRSYLYLSKRNDGKQKREKLNSSNSHAAFASIEWNDVMYSRELQNRRDSAKLPLASQRSKNNSINKPSTGNSSSHNSESGTTQQISQITKKDKLKEREKEYRNFSVITDVPMENKEKQRRQDCYTRSRSSYQLSSHSIVTYEAANKSSLTWSISNPTETKSSSSKNSGKMMPHVTFTRTCRTQNMPKILIANGLSFQSPTSKAESAKAATFNASVVFARSKVEKTKAVLERISARQTSNNIRLYPGTKITTGSSSSSGTRNSSSTFDKQACSADGEGTIIIGKLLSQARNSYERNKSHVGNVNDSLTSGTSRCKCKCQTKHYTTCRNLRKKLVLNLDNSSGISTAITTPRRKSAQTSNIMTGMTRTNQLTKLDSLIGNRSFELEKVVVGRKAKSISSSDNSFDSVTHTVSTSTSHEGKSEQQNFRLLFQRRNPDKRTLSSGYGSGNQTKKQHSAFHLTKYYKGLQRNAIKENNSLKNFILHQARVVNNRKKTMLSEFWPLIINSITNSSQKNIKRNFVERDVGQKASSLLSSFLSYSDLIQNESTTNEKRSNFLVSNEVTGNMKSEVRRSESRLTSGILVAMGKKPSPGIRNDAYRLHFEIKPVKDSQISLKAQQHDISRMMSTRHISIDKAHRNRKNHEKQMHISTVLPTGILSAKKAISRHTKLLSSPIIFSSKLFPLSHDTVKSNGSTARFFNRNRFAGEKRTAQGKKILVANHKCSSRLPLVNTRERSSGSRREDVVKESVVIMPTSTPTLLAVPEYLSNNDNDSGTSYDGENLINAFSRTRNETRVVSHLTRLLHNKRISSDDAGRRITVTFHKTLTENERDNLRKRSKRDTGCKTKGTTYAQPANRAHKGDGCGNEGRRNLSRKLIPMKENPLVSLTWDESSVSAAMNTNNYKNTRYEAIKPKEASINYVTQAAKSLPVGPNISPFATNTEILSPTFGKTRSENRKMTRKIADEGKKVLTTDYNFLQKQWMSDNVNGWNRSNGASSGKSTYGAAEINLSPNFFEPILSIEKREIEPKARIISNYGNVSLEQTLRKVGINRKKLLDKQMQNALIKSSVSPTEYSMFALTTYISSSSLEVQATAKPTDDKVGATDVNNIISSSLSTPQLLGKESMTSPVPSNTIHDDMSTRNEEMDGDTIPTATTASKNYETDSSSLTLLTPPTTNATLLFASSLSSSAGTPVPRTEEETRNSFTSFTTQASSHIDTEEVKATNGFTQVKTSTSSTPYVTDAASMGLIDESKTDAEKFTTVSSVSSTTLQHLSTFTLNDTPTTTSIELSTNGAIIISDASRSDVTPTMPDDGTISFADPTATTSISDKATVDSSLASIVYSTTSPSAVTSISVFPTTSHKDTAPTEMAYTQVQDVSSETNQPQGTTLMSSHAANLEDANMPPTTTMVSSLFTTSNIPLLSSDVEATLTDAITSPAITTTTSILSTDKPGGGEEMLEKENGSTSTSVSPPECDHSNGWEYSEKSKKCVCKTGLVYDHIGTQCTRLVGNECFDDGEASNSDCPLNSLCRPQENSGAQKGICTCIPGYIPTADKSRCMAGWNTDCSSAAMADITIKHQCHPEFDCVSRQGETGGKCACISNRTIGLPYSLERNSSAAEGSLNWGNVQQIKCFLDYGSDCDPLNDECNDFRFLKCSRQNAKCECADSNNQLYDERTHECVARAGTFCTLASNETAASTTDDNKNQRINGDLQFLACIGNSTCTQIGNETNSQFRGTCKCLNGYDQHWQGYCTMKGTSSFPNKQTNNLLTHLSFIFLMSIKFVLA